MKQGSASREKEAAQQLLNKLHHCFDGADDSDSDKDENEDAVLLIAAAASDPASMAPQIQQGSRKLLTFKFFEHPELHARVRCLQQHMEPISFGINYLLQRSSILSNLNLNLALEIDTVFSQEKLTAKCLG
jgi:hypothetical protein